MRYSAWQIAKQAFAKSPQWEKVWREPELKKNYDIIIVGGGGHGLATAYYLAAKFKIKNIAVIEKSWIGSGNVGRNTTIIRSNYLLEGNQPFYEFSMKLWENLEQELNYNIMVSQRGIINLFHSDAQRDAFVRRGNAMMLSGADAQLLDLQQVKQLCPILDFDNSRFPIKGALLQKRAGTVRHDALAWGYARAADKMGVDIIQNCPLEDFIFDKQKCIGVKTKKGNINADKIAVCVAGNSSLVMKKAHIKLPIESHVLQAFVTEALKPIIDNVITFGAGHLYISQSNKGGLVFGGNIDGYNSYARRGDMQLAEEVCQDAMTLMPIIGRARILRHWGGIMDMSMDGSPFIDKTHIQGLFFNGGWCYGGFKATPASGYCYAHLIANDEPHHVAKKYRLDRFIDGNMIDEKGVGAQPNLH